MIGGNTGTTLAHPMGLLVQLAGLVPSSRRWSRNRLATPMAGWGPYWMMETAKPPAWAAHNYIRGWPPLDIPITTTP